MRYIICISFEKTAGGRGAGLSSGSVGKMLGALGILPDYVGAKPSGTFSCWLQARAN